MRKSHHYLVNHPFKVRVLTDHQPLQWMESVATKSGRATRWHMELAAYNFKTEYIPGHCNDVSDTLSRLISVPEGDPSIRPVSDTTWRAPTPTSCAAAAFFRALAVALRHVARPDAANR